MNTDKTKVMVFRKGGILCRDLKFYYQGQELDIVRSFSYLGINSLPGVRFRMHRVHNQVKHKEQFLSLPVIYIIFLKLHLSMF